VLVVSSLLFPFAKLAFPLPLARPLHVGDRLDAIQPVTVDEVAKVLALIPAKSERARERYGQGAKAPGSELAGVLLADSLRGANWPGSEKAVNRTGVANIEKTEAGQQTAP